MRIDDGVELTHCIASIIMRPRDTGLFIGHNIYKSSISISISMPITQSLPRNGRFAVSIGHDGGTNKLAKELREFL